MHNLFNILIYFSSLHVPGIHQEKITETMRRSYLSHCIDGVGLLVGVNKKYILFFILYGTTYLKN